MRVFEAHPQTWKINLGTVKKGSKLEAERGGMPRQAIQSTKPNNHKR